MMTVLQKLLCLLFFVSYQHFCSSFRTKKTVGILFSEKDNYTNVVLELDNTLFKNDRLKSLKSNVKQISNSDYLEASKTLCDVLQTGDGVAAIISLESSASPILESICDKFQVPYIMTSWRPSTTKHTFRTSTFLNFFPKAELFAQALADVVKSLQWSNFVVIYETEEGFIKLQEIVKLQNNILVKQLGRGPDYRSLLKEIKNASFNNIILDCKAEHIIPILKQAKDQNLLNSHNNYFLTSLDAHTLNYEELNTTANITVISLFDYNSQPFMDELLTLMRLSLLFANHYIYRVASKIKTEIVLLCDALVYINHCIEMMPIVPNPVNCFDRRTVFRDGYLLTGWMKEDVPSVRLSGPIKFDASGNRIDFNLHVVNVLAKTTIANWHASTRSLELRRNFYENEYAAVRGLQKITVHVTSRLGEPYLRYRETEEGEIRYGNDRFEGYSMDLIREIANIVGFKYEFHLTESNGYERWDEEHHKWIGLIGDILDKKAHIAVGDLTITHQREEVVDFSVPFMTLGISILHKREEITDTSMFAFLDPFSLSVWIYTATLYLIISVSLYFISRIVPGDWENSHSNDDNPEELKNIWDIKNSLWLTLGSILTQGCDILPKGISSRMALSIWWFFSLILACSYTANLAAFLTKERMEPIIDSAEALAKQTRVKYGLIDGGSTMAFFRDSNVPTYQRMWANMISSRPSVFVNSNSDGVRRVQMSKGDYALLMESTQIEYETETKCDLKQVGTFLNMEAFGIAMPLGAPYRSAISEAILRLQESGMLKELKRKWWKEKRKEPSCRNINQDDFEEMDSADLTLTNTQGIFFILNVGIAIAIVLAIFELLWNVKTISVEEHLTYWEALKIELKIASSVWITKKRIKPVISEGSYSE
nr:ionotropic receptor 6 [Monochamus saltuarius]